MKQRKQFKKNIPFVPSTAPLEKSEPRAAPQNWKTPGSVHNAVLWWTRPCGSPSDVKLFCDWPDEQARHYCSGPWSVTLPGRYEETERISQQIDHLIICRPQLVTVLAALFPFQTKLFANLKLMEIDTLGLI